MDLEYDDAKIFLLLTIFVFINQYHYYYYDMSAKCTQFFQLLVPCRTDVKLLVNYSNDDTQQL